jgi:hypothetical protein
MTERFQTMKKRDNQQKGFHVAHLESRRLFRVRSIPTQRQEDSEFFPKQGGDSPITVFLLIPDRAVVFQQCE